MGLNLRYSPLEWESNNNRFNFGGKQAIGINGSRFGNKEYHVKKTTDTNYLKWKEQMNYRQYDGTVTVHTTIESALAVADDFDTIWVYPGQWKPAATLAITQDSLKLKAVEQGPFGRSLIRTEIRQYGNVDTPCISIEGAHNVEVSGFRITPYDPGTSSVAINISQTAASYGTFIYNNYFYGVGSSSTGPCFVQMGVVDSFNADSTMIYRNDFYCGADSNNTIGQIQWNTAVHAQVRENEFWQQGNNATSHCIKLDDAIGMRGAIFNNRFMNIEVGLDGSAGVAISNPAMTGGGTYIDGNKFINYDGAANCIANRTDECIGLNYWNEHVIAGG